MKSEWWNSILVNSIKSEWWNSSLQVGFSTDGYGNLKHGFYEQEDGTTSWYDHGKLHCVDGPAVTYGPLYGPFAGDKCWFFYGKFHREDGPAVEKSNGTKYWYYHGKLIKCSSQEEFGRIIKLKAFW
jgi:hypothetical protein